MDPTAQVCATAREGNGRAAPSYRLRCPIPGVQVPPNCDLTLGMVCVDKSVPGRTVWKMPADERFTNPVGNLQGGFVAACCDSAMGAATVTWAQGRKVNTANAEMKISFLGPGAAERYSHVHFSGDSLRWGTRRLRRGRARRRRRSPRGQGELHLHPVPSGMTLISGWRRPACDRPRWQSVIRVPGSSSGGGWAPVATTVGRGGTWLDVVKWSWRSRPS